MSKYVIGARVRRYRMHNCGWFFDNMKVHHPEHNLDSVYEITGIRGRNGVDGIRIGWCPDWWDIEYFDYIGPPKNEKFQPTNGFYKFQKTIGG